MVKEFTDSLTVEITQDPKEFKLEPGQVVKSPFKHKHGITYFVGKGWIDNILYEGPSRYGDLWNYKITIKYHYFRDINF